MEDDCMMPLGKGIGFDESENGTHLDEMVRSSVEKALDTMLDEEAEQCRDQHLQRSTDRTDTRAGQCKRKLHTEAGEVNVKVSKLRRQTFKAGSLLGFRATQPVPS